jgi:hypothetical protein
MMSTAPDLLPPVAVFNMGRGSMRALGCLLLLEVPALLHKAQSGCLKGLPETVSCMCRFGPGSA